MNNLDRGFNAFDKQDYSTAFAEWNPLAKKGVAWARYNVANFYLKGWVVGRDVDHGLKEIALVSGEISDLVQIAIPNCEMLGLCIVDPRKKKK